MLYILTYIWVLQIRNAGRNMLLQLLPCKKAEKGRKTSRLRQNYAKKWVFEFTPECWQIFLFQIKKNFSENFIIYKSDVALWSENFYKICVFAYEKVFFWE